MARTHIYRVRLDWTGNQGFGIASAGSYSHTHVIRAPGKPPIAGSSDPAFRGDTTCWNPEELLLASLSAYHQLWYLGFCAEAGVVVIAYEDEPEGTMVEEPDGGGRFAAVVLRPRVTLQEFSDTEAAEALHRMPHAKCFIARSVNFAVSCEPVTRLSTHGPLQVQGSTMGYGPKS